MKRIVKFCLPVILFILVGFTYVRLSYQANWQYNKTKSINLKTSTAYYNYLVSAFLHKRLNITSPITYDLSQYKKKWYPYWGPAPAIYVFPYFIFGRSNSSDVIYTLIAGILNTLLFYFVMRQFIKYFKLRLLFFSFLVVWLSFALASPNLYMSMIGTIWYTNQLVAIFYLLISLLFYFYGLNNPNKKLPVVISVLFYNLAWMSRYTLIFYGLIYLYKQKFFWKTFIGVSSVFILLFFAYNYSRFGNILETGLRYQTASKKYLNALKNNTILSWKNFNHNFTYYFLNHLPFSFEKMTVKIDLEGNSIFSVYPLTLFFFALFQKKSFRSHSISKFLFISFLIISLILIILLLNLGTGWVQFGNRYFLDVVPLLFLTILFVLGNIPALPKLLVLVYGIAINIIGVIAYYKML